MVKEKEIKLFNSSKSSKLKFLNFKDEIDGKRLLIDSSFVKSMGTKIYPQIFIEFIVSKMNVKTINYMSGNYVINLLHYVWRADKKDIILAINNVPPISLNRNTMLLLHNIFYLFSRKELFQNMRYTGLVFVFKYVYFWTIMTLFPPKEIYVQSQLMFERVPEKLKSRVTILNKKIYLDYLHKMRQTLILRKIKT